jgi:hypothetical protein
MLWRMNAKTVRTKLQGKKTYLVAVAGCLYIIGAWAGLWPYDSHVLEILGFGGLAALAARVSRTSGAANALLAILAASALLAAGCRGTHGQAGVGFNPSTGDATASVGLASTNLSGALSATYNVPSGQLGPISLVITFSRAPAADVVRSLREAGARQVTPTQWVITFDLIRDTRDARFVALQKSLKAGAQVTAAK